MSISALELHSVFQENAVTVAVTVWDVASSSAQVVSTTTSSSVV